jgi:hypothetical protein
MAWRQKLPAAGAQASAPPRMSAATDPFAGHPLSGEGVRRVDPLGPQAVPATDDPAWQPIDDPLDGDTKASAAVIFREIPNVNVQTGWTITAVRRALIDLSAGVFDGPSQLIDSLFSDSRVQASMASINGGLFSRPITWEIPAGFEKDADAIACLAAWQAAWPSIGTEAALSDAISWDVMLGFWVAQILWDTTGPQWIPQISPWHPRFTYYNWTARRYIATSMDGQITIEPGDGKWIVHAPHGEYRGWFHGAVRSISPWWLARNYALRDAARYSEKHGFPIIKAWTPFGADPVAINNFREALRRIGQESIAQLSRSQDPKVGEYDLEFLEAKDQSWEVFFKLIEQCNMEITLAIQAQNLTSEVKEGSLAAAREHGDVKQTLLQSKARGFCRTLYTQLAKPFAAINYGRPEIAPRPVWDIKPIEDKKTLALALMNMSLGLNYLRVAGKRVKDVRALAAQFGIDLGELEDVVPLGVEVAGTTGDTPPVAPDSTDDSESDDEKNENETT